MSSEDSFVAGAQRSFGRAVVKSVLESDIEESASSSADNTSHQNQHHTSDGGHMPRRQTAIEVDEIELARMQLLAKISRFSMIALCICMTVMAWNSIIFAPTIATACLGFYLFLLSTLICCYEVALKLVSKHIAQNFGFLYSGSGRCIFILFMATLCFHFGVIGEVLFSLLIIYLAFQLYIYIKHPQFEIYMKKLHYYDKVTLK